MILEQKILETLEKASRRLEGLWIDYNGKEIGGSIEERHWSAIVEVPERQGLASYQVLETNGDGSYSIRNFSIDSEAVEPIVKAYTSYIIAPSFKDEEMVGINDAFSILLPSEKQRLKTLFGSLQNNRSILEKNIIPLDQVSPFEGHCGEVRTVVDDSVKMHYVNIKGAQEHAHPMTEYYHVVNGYGNMILNGKSFPIKQGDTITIPPYTMHRAIEGKKGLEVFITMMPCPQGEKGHLMRSDL